MGSCVILYRDLIDIGVSVCVCVCEIIALKRRNGVEALTNPIAAKDTARNTPNSPQILSLIGGWLDSWSCTMKRETKRRVTTLHDLSVELCCAPTALNRTK